MSNDPKQNENAPEESAENTHHLIQGRLEKMEELGREVDLYPFAYDRTHTSGQIRADEERLTADEVKVRFPGRIMAKRGTGKTLFVPIQDEWGRIQAYFRKDDLGEERFRQIQKLIDIGDWIVLRADCTDAFIADHGMTGWWTSRLPGPMFLRRITDIDADSTLPALTIYIPTRYPLLLPIRSSSSERSRAERAAVVAALLRAYIIGPHLVATSRCCQYL